MSTAIIYNAAYTFYNCIDYNITTSFNTDSSNHTTINADKLKNSLLPCTAKVNVDYWYIVPQIVGLTISMVYLIQTSKLKKENKTIPTRKNIPRRFRWKCRRYNGEEHSKQQKLTGYSC
jgi:hypothetical protein